MSDPRFKEYRADALAKELEYTKKQITLERVTDQTKDIRPLILAEIDMRMMAIWRGLETTTLETIGHLQGEATALRELRNWITGDDLRDDLSSLAEEIREHVERFPALKQELRKPWGDKV